MAERRVERRERDLDSTIEVLSGSSDSEDVVIVGSQKRIINLDPETPTKEDNSPINRIKSLVVKKALPNKMAEDGEILSSPDVADAVEITLHADTGISSDEDLLGGDSPLKVKKDVTPPPRKEESSNKQEKSTSKSEKSSSSSRPDKREDKSSSRSISSGSSQPPRLPTQKQVGAVREVDEDIEMDHLEILAPLQGKSKAKLSKSKEKNSPSKSKDGRTSGKISPIDTGRKRGHEDDSRRTSDNDNEDRKRASKKSSANEAEDIRKQLLMKLGRESSNKMKDERSRERDSRRERDDKNRPIKVTKDEKSSTERQKDNLLVDRQREDRTIDRNRERSLKDKQLSSDRNDRRRKEEESPNQKPRSVINKDVNRDASTKSRTENSASDRKDKKKEKKRERDEKERDKDKSNKKKKKRKHKESDSADAKGDTPTQDEVKLKKSPDAEESKKRQRVREPSYDDISSPEFKKSPPILKPDSKDATSDSEPPTPPSSVEMTPSRSPTPERSPTPVRKRTYYPAIEGCRSVEEFSWLNRIEEGTYGVVYRAKDKRTDEIVALKRLKMEKEKEGFPITSLREINTLLKAQHPNIVTVREIVVGNNMDKIYIVMDYLEHDLKSLMETMKEPFLVGEVKTLMIQLLKGVQHMHDNWILHRDIKASNLLLNHKGILKIGDFGLAREYGSPLKKYTSIVVTLWYRAPELLLGQKEYSCPIDVWSVGCVFAELLTMKPLFPGKSEIDQINKIFKELGTPNDKIWPGPPAYSELPQVKKMNIAQHPYNNLRKRFGANLTDVGFDLLNSLLTYDPSKRITAEDALKHGYFEEAPRPVHPSMFPTWPAKSELGHKTKRNASPKAPEGGGQSNALMGGNEGGFHMGGTTKGPSAKGHGFNLKF